jgi:hypothetical protein
MMRGDFTNLSERKLMECLNRLGYDIEIKVRPANEPVGHLTVALARFPAIAKNEHPNYLRRPPISDPSARQGTQGKRATRPPGFTPGQGCKRAVV